jgi:limonene-1,2-epoxide hydrolase
MTTSTAPPDIAAIHSPASPARRELLGTVGAALALGVLASVPARAAQTDAAGPSAAAPLTLHVVRDFCAAWSTLDPARVAAFFADDAVYRVTETTPPAVGRQAITQLLQRFLQRAQQVRFEILREYAAGPIVLNERHDHFTGPQGARVFHVAGVFFVRDGKIAEWTDYIIRP